jgi:2-methylisocitrate lyase-like PEP mutase family enzyme
VAASVTGRSDLGLVTMSEMAERARQVFLATGLPLVVDADTGYGGLLNVVRAVQELGQAGAAGCQLEDQVHPKRCGHFEGKRVVGVEEMLARLRAARHACRDPDFVLVARTDARAPLGLEAALARASAYARAGADVVFIEAPESEAELRLIGEALPGVLKLVNMVEGGKTPVLPSSKLSALGFKVILYPTSTLRAAGKALQSCAQRLRSGGDTLGYEDRLLSFAERNHITGLAELQELELRLGAPGPGALAPKS